MSGRRLPIVEGVRFPAYVVWELTLRCDQRCVFCGSRAADNRPNELTTGEALDVVDALARAGTREVVLIGGEAYLHDGITEILARLRERGITPVMTTGGRGIDRARARSLADAGLARASVSIDGIGATHDLLRATPGSYDAAVAALAELRDAGVEIAANTNVNRVNKAELEALYDHLRCAGVCAWQIQLTAPLGRAADRPSLLIQPWDLIELMPRIDAICRRAADDGILVMPGNNLGYFGPEEARLRSLDPQGRDHFSGCQAGRLVLGIESDGGVKGCPSLQSDAYLAGNLREADLDSLWNRPAMTRASSRGIEDLWGFCQRCVFAEICRGGCSFTAHSILGRPGNNPYCHFRARTLAAEGLRERLVPARRAPGTPFDNGRFELVVEPFDAPDPEVDIDARSRARRGTRSLPLIEDAELHDGHGTLPNDRA